MRRFLALLPTLAALSLSGCGYNTFQSTDERIKACWSEVLTKHLLAPHTPAHRT